MKYTSVTERGLIASEQTDFKVRRINDRMLEQEFDPVCHGVNEVSSH